VSLRHAVVLLVALAAAGAPRPTSASPAPMTRAELINLAKSGVGYSYYWGHGSWRTDGASHGSCSGSCPSCSHSGSYGADCSGFAAKVWQVPSPIAVSTDSHPYSTYNFRNETTHWTRISRDATKQADCLVHNSSGSGHIVVYESGDPWGSFWAYECKGCSYGCVHNLRTASSDYIAIQRHNLTEAVAQGTLQGVVYVGTDTNARLPGATIKLNTGATATARASDAYWSFDLAPGDYTATVSAAGYTTRSRTCTVTAGGAVWCSVGLTASCTPDCSGRECGPDPTCATSCGSCASGDTCTAAGQCQTPCTPSCAGRECGPDPSCSKSCGTCASGTSCDATGQCAACVPACAGLECGPDPVCGQSCGTCTGGLSCSLLGQCEAIDCTADCTGRACGPDPLCGESCAICAAETVCGATGQCGAIDPARGKLYGYAVVLPRAGGSLEQAVHVSRARLTIDSGEEAQADPDGYYEVLVAPGTRTVTAHADGMAPGSQACTVTAGGYTECVVALAAVVGGEDGNPDEVHGGCAVAAGPTPVPAALFALLAALRTRRRRR
jgi:MYXO-CTERM domain-containing protein